MKAEGALFGLASFSALVNFFLVALTALSPAIVYLNASSYKDMNTGYNRRQLDGQLT